MSGYPKNRRYVEYEDEPSCLRLLRYSGLPFLYVLSVCANIVGMICMGIITEYWASSDNPTCFLYSQTSSASLAYKFGSSLSNCYWVIYGALPPTLIAMICGIYYMCGVFGEPRDDVEEDKQIRNTILITIMMGVASLFLLAVCCTLAEGMRVTCMNMDLNAVNGKGVNCMDKLNLRVAQYNFPVESSVMIHSASAGLWTGMACFFLIDIIHVSSIYRKSF